MPPHSVVILNSFQDLVKLHCFTRYLVKQMTRGCLALVAILVGFKGGVEGFCGAFIAKSIA